MAESELERFSRRLDWNLLRTYLVIVQEGGISRAADRLFLRQPSVSNALKRLEQQLDRRLIERGHGSFRVTDAGETLYRECLEIFGNVSRLALLMQEVEEEIRGRVSISMASHVTCDLLDAALAEFHVCHPEVSFSIDVATSEDVSQAVRQKTASLGVCLMRNREPELDYQLMYREHFGFYCGCRHALFGRKNLSLADLRGQRFVSFKTDLLSDVLRPVALFRAQADLDSAVTGVSSHLEEVRRMILCGLGIGPLPIHVVERDVRDGLLWRLPPYEHAPPIDVFLVSSPRAHLSRAENAFLHALQEKIESVPLTERVYPRADYETPG
jgi:DNA-binding transcriptional LysR family regulator